MRSLTLAVVRTVLLSFFSQCCPSGTPPKPKTPCEVESPSPSRHAVQSPRPSPSVPSPATLAPERVQAHVVRVIDGDTIDVEIEGEVYCVRQLGVDCPEADCEFGQLATDVNRALVEGKRVELEKDMPDTDEHGRLLRYVFVGGMMVNAKLLRLGYASAVTVAPDMTHSEKFLALEREARLSGVGLCLRRDSPLPTGSALAAQDMAQ